MGVDEGFATSRGTTRDANRVARHATSDRLKTPVLKRIDDFGGGARENKKKFR